MCSMSMEGQTGPHAGFRGFGLTLQATAGITGVTGWPDRLPVGTGVAYTDWVATHVGMIGILAALDHRRRTGEGQYIDMSQLEASTLVLDAGLLDALNTGRVAKPLGNRDLRYAPHGVYPCADDERGSDRWVAIAVTSDEQWRAFAESLGQSDWLDDDSLCEVAGRLAAQDALDDAICEWTRQQTVDQVEQTLQAVGVPAHRASTVQDAHEDPQLAHREHWWMSDHPAIGEMSYESPSWAAERYAAAKTVAVAAAGAAFRVCLSRAVRVLGSGVSAVDRRRGGGVNEFVVIAALRRGNLAVLATTVQLTARYPRQARV